MNIPYFGAEAVRSALPFDRAISGIEEALNGGVDPENDSPRIFSPAPDGEFLLMPTNATPMTGVKVATIAPLNKDKNLPKIQALYILFDADSLSPVAIVEGTELTAIRTPASTLAAVKHLVAADSSFPKAPRILVFGAGVQALNHVRASLTVYPAASFGVVGRTASRTTQLIETLTNEGVEVQQEEPSAVANYDIILCVTSSSEPVFDGRLPQDHAVVASVGQHGLNAREVDTALVLRSDVYVEGRASSWRESGDLALARDISEWQAMDLANIQDLVRGEFTRNLGRPALYTGVGMAWEDLALATVIYKNL
ncbi:ornithine cyclodeaminase family protein [Nesterenkonia massiliensis]|uniref:ornithine cyclodeaminase family protein n=1 Tax=Nesterenkonia massiliensis TaxID=1232429 RepID=UPI000422B3C7|nr:ornithine cyclodeaminase family protein [Nesterenkonia massiliensis]